MKSIITLALLALLLFFGNNLSAQTYQKKDLAAKVSNTKPIKNKIA